VHLADRITSSPVSSLHHLTGNDALSDVPSVSRRNGSQMELSLGCMMGGPRQCEAKVVNLCSHLCTRVRPHIVVWEENLLHVRTHSSNTHAFSFFSIQHSTYSFLQSKIKSLHLNCFLILHHFHSCNSEIPSGRTMKLYTKVQESLID
jgi:hypothetical protein